MDRVNVHLDGGSSDRLTWRVQCGTTRLGATPRRRGSVIQCGPGTRFVRIFAGTDPATRKRVRQETVHGKKAKADKRLAEMHLEMETPRKPACS